MWANAVEVMRRTQGDELAGLHFQIRKTQMHRYVKHLAVLVIAVAVIFVVARYQMVQQSAELAAEQNP